MRGAIIVLLVACACASKLNAPPGTKVQSFLWTSRLESLALTTTPLSQPPQITSLPGYNGPSLSMYSGYITVNASAGRALFYWLVEATRVDPTTAPIIFWYQGGPGCSGLGGLMTENGPFLPNPAGGLMENPIAWTHLANVVYLEQPAFVGFSYSNTSSDMNTNDAIAAADNYAFVQGFLKAFPDYQGGPYNLNQPIFLDAFPLNLVFDVGRTPHLALW